MKRALFAWTLLSLFAAPTAAQEIPSWKGPAWYLLGYMDGFGWLGIADGPYGEEKACRTDENRRNAARVEQDVSFECFYLKQEPQKDNLGGIVID